jgi:proteic killer suppression protein
MLVPAISAVYRLLATAQTGITRCVIDSDALCGRSVIKGFADRETASIWQGRRSRKLPDDIQAVALRKLRMLNQARALSDLTVPPGNRLEALKGERLGQHGIRINRQWRICFVWREGEPDEVEIVDYHR